MNTNALEVNRVRLYPRDLIPTRELFSQPALDALRSAFGFSGSSPLDGDEVEDDEEDGGLLFTNGRPSQTPDDWPGSLAPLQVLIQSTRIEIAAHACPRSSLALAADPDSLIDQFLAEFGAICDDLLPQKGDWVDQHIFESFESTWVGRLEVDPIDLIDPRLRRLLPAVKSLTESDPRFRVLLSLDELSFRLLHNITDCSLLESQVNLTDKQFRLEPRSAVPGAERAWFSTAPFSSERLLNLLKQIEAAYRAG